MGKSRAGSRPSVTGGAFGSSGRLFPGDVPLSWTRAKDMAFSCWTGAEIVLVGDSYVGLECSVSGRSLQAEMSRDSALIVYWPVVRVNG